MNDLRGYTVAELTFLVFNTEKYYTCMTEAGLFSLMHELRIDGIAYTTDQWDMLCRDYRDDLEERNA
jgi:hypothetical protein